MFPRSSRGRKQRGHRRQRRGSSNSSSRYIDLADLVRRHYGQHPYFLPNYRRRYRTPASRAGTNRYNLRNLNEPFVNLATELPLDYRAVSSRDIATTTSHLCYSPLTQSILNTNASNETNLEGQNDNMEEANAKERNREIINETPKSQSDTQIVARQSPNASDSKSSISTATTTSTIVPTSFSHILESSSSCLHQDCYSLRDPLQLISSETSNHFSNSENQEDLLGDLLNVDNDDFSAQSRDYDTYDIPNLASYDYFCESMLNDTGEGNINQDYDEETPSETVLPEAPVSNIVETGDSHEVEEQENEDEVGDVEDATNEDVNEQNSDADLEAGGDGHHNDVGFSIEITITTANDTNSDESLGDTQEADNNE